MAKKEGFVVTPWEVKGKIDYSKLIKQFGTEPLTPALLKRLYKSAGESHFMLRRGVYFSHRNLKWLLDQYDKGNKFFLYTGRGSSAHLHIGHLVPFIITKWLQDKFGTELWIQFTDDEKFLFSKNSEAKLETYTNFARENALDIIALGFKPKNTKFLIDTRPETAGLMYREAIKVAKRLTATTAKAVFGFKDSDNVGRFFYTSMQAVPAFLPSILKKKNMPCLIPLGVDLGGRRIIKKDILPKLGFYKPALLHGKLVSGLLEGGKMSASIPNSAIWTTDTDEQVRDKIIKHAFSGGRGTVKEHRKKGGVPEVDASYQWLYAMFEPDDKKIQKIYDEYKSGKMLTRELKEILIDKVTAFLRKHRKERKKAENKLDKFLYP
jgi:tryptophanyl-tRNA synthetase